MRVGGRPENLTELLIAPVTRSLPAPGKILLSDSPGPPACDPRQLASAVLTTSTQPSDARFARMPYVYAIPSLNHLDEGDIVAVHPSGRVDTLFRERSQDNTLFVTDRCNSNCLMCSQPPKDVNDLDHHYRVNATLVRLIPRTTRTLGITGGEPTLLGARFPALLRLLQTELPETEVHVLTNGRAFAWPTVVQAVRAAATPRVTFGVPLYSDYAVQHNYVVQAKNAFAQTVLGLYNLARCELRVEIRVVLHKQTCDRLPKLARFIHRNLPFAAHVAFMGLEDTGYTPRNRAILSAEPSDYVAPLAEAVAYLSDFRFMVSIYNLQLCLLPSTLWRYCRSSISDWKRAYLDECNRCDVAGSCGGVFGTSRIHSESIHAIRLTTGLQRE